MSGPALIMREVHRLRKLARDLQDQIERGPRQLKAHHAKVGRQETLLREEQDTIKKLKVGIHEKEVSLKTSHTQIAKYEKQLSESASKKEYDALQNEIAIARARTLQLEDEIFAAITEGEERAAKVPELEKSVRQAKDDAAAFEKGMAERNAGLSAHLSETQARLKEVEATIPAENRTEYNRIVKTMGPDGFAAVIDRNCSACNTALTVQHYTDLQQNLFAVCRSCWRILYLPEGAIPWTASVETHDEA
jgi:predicted  nucleic acid-binding Zn-ribbon protein